MFYFTCACIFMMIHKLMTPYKIKILTFDLTFLSLPIGCFEQRHHNSDNNTMHSNIVYLLPVPEFTPTWIKYILGNNFVYEPFCV